MCLHFLWHFVFSDASKPSSRVSSSDHHTSTWSLWCFSLERYYTLFYLFCVLQLTHKNRLCSLEQKVSETSKKVGKLYGRSWSLSLSNDNSEEFNKFQKSLVSFHTANAVGAVHGAALGCGHLVRVVWTPFVLGMVGLICMVVVGAGVVLHRRLGGGGGVWGGLDFFFKRVWSI